MSQSDVRRVAVVLLLAWGTALATTAIGPALAPFLFMGYWFPPGKPDDWVGAIRNGLVNWMFYFFLYAWAFFLIERRYLRRN